MKKERSKNIRIDIALLIALFSMEALIIFLLTPLYTAFVTNYLYKNTLAPTAMRYGIDLFDTLVRSVGFTTVAAAIFMNVKKKNCIAVYAGAICFRLVGNILMSLFLYRSLELNEIIMALNVLLIDSLIFICAIFIANFFKKRKAVLTINENGFVNKVNVFKKHKFLTPMIPCLLGMSALLSLVKIVTRTVGLIQGYFENLLSTLVGFCADVLVLPIAFLAGGGFLIFLYKKNEAKKAIAKIYDN